MFVLDRTEQAADQLARLRAAPDLQKRYKAVSKALRLLAENPRHPGLQTHQWKGNVCPHGDKLWEAYAENQTPGAYRIFFCYPPEPPAGASKSSVAVPGERSEDPPRPKRILILAITPHP